MEGEGLHEEPLMIIIPVGSVSASFVTPSCNQRLECLLWKWTRDGSVSCPEEPDDVISCLGHLWIRRFGTMMAATVTSLFFPSAHEHVPSQR